MTDVPITTLTIAAAVGCGLVAGDEGARSNRTRAGNCRDALDQRRGAESVVTWRMPGPVYVVTASVLCLLGVIFVTMAFNVPLNNALAGVAPASPDAERVWTRYLSVWTAWNHVRTVAPIVSAGCFILALLDYR